MALLTRRLRLTRMMLDLTCAAEGTRENLSK
jgi:hypothetical protein